MTLFSPVDILLGIFMDFTSFQKWPIIINVTARWRKTDLNKFHYGVEYYNCTFHSFNLQIGSSLCTYYFIKTILETYACQIIHNLFKKSFSCFYNRIFVVLCFQRTTLVSRFKKRGDSFYYHQNQAVLPGQHLGKILWSICQIFKLQSLFFRWSYI